ncbi:MAG: proprotein convertase P-domain-containing protein [Myxococcales bacterium]|nr:proprotein convertase P-domain-containing protein [Myxococcales bacterium]
MNRTRISRQVGIKSGVGLLASALLALASCGSPNETQERELPGSAEEGTKPSAQPGAQPGVQPGRAPAYAPDSVLVRYKAGVATQRVRAASVDQLKGSIEDVNGDGVDDNFANIAPDGNLVKINLDRSISVEDALAQLRKDPSVAYAEPNYLVYSLATPNDTRFNELYGLHNTGQSAGTIDADIDAVEAWDATTGDSAVVVGVIDTGIDYTHQDLAANMWVNPGEIPGNGIDDDTNGVIDDVHGYNAITNGGNPLDDHDHGSHCAGTIGAVGNNNLGVVGVNWNVSLMAMKFLSSGGSGTTADAIESVDYAVGRKNAGVNLRVLSNSWGGGGFSQALADAITAANAADILFVAAAGNAGSDNDATPSYPASYDIANVLAVAATDRNDAMASFSNYGLTSVDLGAPGVNILSTTRNNTYSVFSGTSMATPHVAGVAALVLSSNSTLSTAELKAVLMDSGDTKASLTGKTVSGKRLNAAAALAEAGPPVPRFNLSASPNGRVINQAASTTYDVDLSAVAGFTGNVDLTVTSQPAINATITATPSTVGVPGASVVSVATSMATAPGTYTLTITGTSGALTKSRAVSLLVRPFGTVELALPSTDTPLAIPSGPPAGINSTINVAQPMTIAEVQVDLNITHTWIGDLLVTLTSPSGTVVTLHNRTGGSADNIHQTYTFPTQFLDQQAAGPWVLHVDDNFTADTGTLDSWTLRLIGVPSAATFALAATPASQTISQDGSASYNIAVSPLGDFTGSVAFSVASEPAFPGTLTIDPASAPVPGTATLTATTSCATTPGTYALTITGQSGAITKTAQVSLTVQPYGTATLSVPGAGTPTPIPDNNPTGVTSTATATATGSVLGLAVEVHIAHTYIGDLTVSLIGPNNQTVVLHNRAGGSTDNIDQTYNVTAFNGQPVTGEWKLKVADALIGFSGTLTSWTLRPTVSTPPPPPTSAFTFAANRLRVNFTDASSDTGCGGGGVVSRSWNFGDGNSSTAQNPIHTYAAPGTYSVTLTVTDNEGLTGSSTQQVTVVKPAPTLAIERVSRNRAKFEYVVDMTWAGADGALVELWRNGLIVDLPDNDGVYRDAFRRFENSFTWKLCELHSTAYCSNEVSVVFGASEDQVTVVVKQAGGETISRVMMVEDEK